MASLRNTWVRNVSKTMIYATKSQSMTNLAMGKLGKKETRQKSAALQSNVMELCWLSCSKQKSLILFRVSLP